MGNCFESIASQGGGPSNKPKGHISTGVTDGATGVLFCALYDYEPIDEGDLQFKRGDTLEVINRMVENAEGWWKAKNKTTGKVGVVPSNFLAEAKTSDSFANELWWFDVDRKSATKQLILPGNPRGTFLVRRSKDENVFTLSVKNFDDLQEEMDVKNYHILFDSGKYFISTENKFSRIQDLIAHFQKDANGLCCRLTEPCLKEHELIPFKSLEVPRSHIQVIEKIGAGKFGEVWKGKYKRRLDVAVKKMIPGKMEADRFLEEAKMMHRVNHRRLIQLMGVVTVDEPMLIVTELLENGNLLHYLQEDRGQKVLFPHLLDIAAQIAEGMEYLEQKNYIHRDLRAANILVGKNNSIKVADFGLAKVLLGDVYELGQESKFPVRWSSPETLEYRIFSIKSDVWSYGILLFELVTYGQVPYAGMNAYEMVEKIRDGYKMPNPAGKNHRFIICPDKMYDLMKQCWEFEPKNRPTFARLKNFFEDFYIETEKPYIPEELY